jgi:alpha-beta hydrolase superfamily lysophospholipase
MRENKTVGPNLKTYFYYTNMMADDSSAKGVIVIAPGIEGTGAVYDEIGDYLDSKGYALYTLDNWGYAKTGKVAKTTFKNWRAKDFHFASYNVHALSVLAKQKHPNVPLYLIGNDFGAMLSLYLIREFPDVVDKIVTIGWGAPRLEDLGFWFTSFIRKIFFFDDNPAKRAHNGKNRMLSMRFEHKEKYAWLSSDSSQVKKIKDAGFIDQPGTVGHYYRYYSRKIRTPYLMLMKKTDRTTPILFMSGDQDLLTAKGRTTKALERFYKGKRFTNVESMIVEGRHELLFERNRFENMDVILKWLTGEVIVEPVKHEQVQVEVVNEVPSVGTRKERVIYKEPEEKQTSTNNTQYAFQEAEEDLLIRTNKEQE